MPDNEHQNNQNNDQGNNDQGNDDLKMVEYEGHQIPQDLLNKINGRVRGVADNAEKKYGELSEKYNSLATENKNLKEQNMTDEEKRVQEETERADRMNALEQENRSLKDEQRQAKIDNALSDELAKDDNKVVNIKHAQILFAAWSQTDLVDGKVVVKVNGQEFSVEDAVKAFLAIPENAHLVRSDARGGAGTEQRDHDSGSSSYKFFTQDQLNNDPQARKAYNEQVRQGLIPEIRK